MILSGRLPIGNTPILCRILTGATLFTIAYGWELVLPVTWRAVHTWLQRIRPPAAHPCGIGRSSRYSYGGIGLEIASVVGFQHYKPFTRKLFLRRTLLAVVDDHIPRPPPMSTCSYWLPGVATVEDSVLPKTPSSDAQDLRFPALGFDDISSYLRQPPKFDSSTQSANFSTHVSPASTFLSLSSVSVADVSVACVVSSHSISQPQTAALSDDYSGDQGELHDDTNAIPNAILDDGQVFYYVMDRIGKGGWGSVFVALTNPRDGNPNFPRKVAIKAYSKESMRRWDQFYDLVYNEEKLLRHVTSQPEGNLVTTLLSSFQDQDNVYMVMRLYPSDLCAMLANLHVDLSLDQIRFYAAELLLGIDQLQKRCIIHGDLKPENVLVTPSGHLTIADLTHAYQVDDEWRNCMWLASRKYFSVGSPGYYAPEMMNVTLLNIDGYTGQADMWTYGLMLGELYRRGPITPFHNASHEKHPELTDEWNVADDLQDLEDPALRDLLLKLLEKNPEKRIRLPDVKKHPFFEEIDWDWIEQRQWSPPFVKSVKLIGINHCIRLSTMSMNKHIPPKYIDWDFFNFKCRPEQLLDPTHGDCELQILPPELGRP
ncbi:hypothetical protein EW146_g2083 [Bondarzewia mesenterica]|uniref:non-specific serine/threonine protein kinase n=1 Tax=Bondarzewia mesenterica TaxID=1095465 RepID=A0A4S4M1T7_9AGAM|nr:hypothetical protein EW146_g2083 [Bondarzewia mesenterica]